jgi:biofilm PGA synthesis N-glycosyltransferase PgaC
MPYIHGLFSARRPPARHAQRSIPRQRDGRPGSRAAAAGGGGHDSGTHVFFDPTGRRWLWIKLAAVMVVAIVLAGCAVAWPRINNAPAPSVSTHDLAPIPTVRADPPVIGSGALVRVMRVVTDGATPIALQEPFTHEVLRPLRAAEADALRGVPYVIERFGYGVAAKRTLSLTFDDGPDQINTPKLLDLLSGEGVAATFFVTGQQAAKNPELMRRIVAEGHAVGNHTFSHRDLTTVSPEEYRHELIATDRIIRASTNTYTTMFRPPYGGIDDYSLSHEVMVLLRAQQLGYTTVNYDHDSNDWRHPNDDNIDAPSLAGDNITMLMHDGGGDRHTTIAYVERLIASAKAAGYTFHTVPQANPMLVGQTGTVDADLWDSVTMTGARAWLTLPERIVGLLFALAVGSVLVGGAINIALALWRRVRRRNGFTGDLAITGLPVTVVIAAYNEQTVIARTLESLQHSTYPDLELLVVDDGSTDRTADVVTGLALQDPRIRLIQQKNAGKSAALNRAFNQARGDIIVTLDADTLFTPDTVTRLVRHFDADAEGNLAAVAGVVKVGNQRNLLTRWQALEYVVQIGIERAAQDTLGAIMIVPGACAAWRKTAVQRAGGYTSATLAEDFDVSLQLQRLGYRIVQDDDAVCFTEAPETPSALIKQRTRWMFGSLQAIWKHRSMMLNPRCGWVGMVLLPYAALSILVPLIFLPFVYTVAVLAIAERGIGFIFFYAALFIAAQLVVAAIGVLLMREKLSLLLMIPIHRAMYEPLRVYLLYKSLFTALRGTKLGWNKLARTGTATLDATLEPVLRLDPVRSFEPRMIDLREGLGAAPVGSASAR